MTNCFIRQTTLIAVSGTSDYMAIYVNVPIPGGGEVICYRVPAFQEKQKQELLPLAFSETYLEDCKIK